MTDDDLDTAYREGQVTKRAFVRQLIDQGHDMASALARAETLVSSTPPSAAVPTPDAPREGRGSEPVHGTPTMNENLDINFVGDGYVVYQPSRKRMHSLNHTAALVLELCTGEHDVDAITGLLQSSFDLEDPPRAEVDLCLRQLRDEGLVE